MFPRIEFSQEKNFILKETRGINFDDVIEAILEGNIINDLEHHNKKKYPNQHVLVVKINEYAYAVPYVMKDENKTAYLKTVYPSRILTKKYLHKSL